MTTPPHLSTLNVTPSDARYFSWSLTDQITWHIEHYLPLVLAWIEEWLGASDNPQGIKILLTNYETMVSQPDEFFNSINNFYGVQNPLKGLQTKAKTPQPGELHFRRGIPDEWREVFTPKQAERATQMITPRLYEKFGWYRDISA